MNANHCVGGETDFGNHSTQSVLFSGGLNTGLLDSVSVRVLESIEMSPFKMPPELSSQHSYNEYIDRTFSEGKLDTCPTFLG